MHGAAMARSGIDAQHVQCCRIADIRKIAFRATRADHAEIIRVKLIISLVNVVRCDHGEESMIVQTHVRFAEQSSYHVRDRNVHVDRQRQHLVLLITHVEYVNVRQIFDQKFTVILVPQIPVHHELRAGQLIHAYNNLRL